MTLGGATAGLGNTNVGGFGIALEANRAGILDIDVLRNTVAANVTEPGVINAAMYVQAANSGGGGSNVCANILQNSLTADPADDPISDVVLDNLTSTIRIEGWNAGTVASYLAATRHGHARHPGGRACPWKRRSWPVGRVLSPSGLATDRGATIHLGPPLPTGSCGLPAYSGGPPSDARCSTLLRAGFAEPTGSLRPLVVSCTTVSPLPTCAGGLFSVALSRGSPRVGVAHRPALRSPDLPRRPSQTSLAPYAAVARPAPPHGQGSGDSSAGTPKMAPGPTTPGRRSDPARSVGRTQLRFSAVSSMTNDVCSEESSVPVKLTVTVWPAKAETLNERSV